MLAQLRPAFIMLTLLSLLTGAVYPAVITAVSQLLFPQQAQGSLIERDGHVIGSLLIGQTCSSAKYFQSRPSAAGSGYDASASSGSNLGPTSKALVERVQTDVARWSKLHPGSTVPSDLVTTSASGLDPHISPQSAEYQVESVAAARKLTPDQVRELVSAHTQPRTLGFIGEPTVNVLELNLALDRLQ